MFSFWKSIVWTSVPKSLEFEGAPNLPKRAQKSAKILVKSTQFFTNPKQLLLYFYALIFFEYQILNFFRFVFFCFLWVFCMRLIFDGFL